MITVVGVRFKKAGKVYYFDPDDLEIEQGNMVVVETARGIECGEIVVGPKQVVENEIVQPLKKVIRAVNEEDQAQIEHNTRNALKAHETALEKIEEHKLPMKLIDTEYTFDNTKLIFYFTADGRVDFRELVKDLAAIFKIRIELRQIGVRDEAKMIGGLGPCGRPLCCSSFLGDFEPVSIRMAKEQNLSLNPTKISGICGRLMCCLKYESEVYKEAKEELPNIGSTVLTEYGKAEVEDINILQGLVKVKVEDEKFTLDVDEIEEITRDITKPKKKPKETEEPQIKPSGSDNYDGSHNGNKDANNKEADPKTSKRSRKPRRRNNRNRKSKIQSNNKQPQV